jgi:hypothetical protein
MTVYDTSNMCSKISVVELTVVSINVWRSFIHILALLLYFAFDRLLFVKF